MIDCGNNPSLLLTSVAELSLSMIHISQEGSTHNQYNRSHMPNKILFEIEKRKHIKMRNDTWHSNIWLPENDNKKIYFSYLLVKTHY